MPQSDSSKTYMRAVRPWPSPADLLSGWTAGVFEVSRFSCMKFLGVLWGLRLRQTEQRLALASLSMLPAAITRASASGLHLFGAQYPPHLFPCLRFVAYLAIGLTQNSGPSGSLLLSRKKFSFSASCRFSPALCNGDVTPTVRVLLNPASAQSIEVDRAPVSLQTKRRICRLKCWA
jgi:hypothetical protein